VFWLRTKNDRKVESANGAARQGAWSYMIIVLSLYGFKFGRAIALGGERREAAVRPDL